MKKISKNAHSPADLGGNLGSHGSCRYRAGTSDLCGTDDLPTRAHADERTIEIRRPLDRSSPQWRTDIGADQVKQPQLMTT